MSSFTPGPWEAKCQTGATWGVWGKSKKWAVAYCREEDARLIAAAPEMRALLYAAHDKLADLYNVYEFDDDGYLVDLCSEIRALIRRIDGKEVNPV